MQVAYVVNQYPTVSHTFIRREIQSLEKLGHRIERFSIRDTRGAVIDPLDIEESRKTHCLLHPPACLLAAVQVAITHPIAFTKALGSALKLWRQARGGLIRHLAYLGEASHLLKQLPGNVEHLHAHFGTNSASVAMLCNILGGPRFSFTVHGPEEFDRPETESLSTKIEQAAFVVAISNFGKSQLQRWCPAEHWSKIHVVRCGVEDDFLARKPAPITSSRRFVCVARLSPQKGLMTLIEAAAGLADEGADFELILVGDGPLRAELENRIAAAKLQDRVRMVGSQTGDQIREWLESSRCFVLPSFAEGLPVVIMEAFALARPVVSTCVAGIPELVVDEQNGWILPAGSVDDLVKAMRQVLSKSEDELFQMGLRGRERVLEFHSVMIEAKRLADLFATGASASHC